MSDEKTGHGSISVLFQSQILPHRQWDYFQQQPLPSNRKELYGLNRNLVTCSCAASSDFHCSLVNLYTSNHESLFARLNENNPKQIFLLEHAYQTMRRPNIHHSNQFAPLNRRVSCYRPIQSNDLFDRFAQESFTYFGFILCK